MKRSIHRLLLLAWRTLPIPLIVRRLYLRLVAGSFLVGALAVIKDKEGRVLLVRRTYNADCPWALPGGWVQQNESPAEAVAREVEEETGVRVRVGAVLAVCRGPFAELVVGYRCEIGADRPVVASVEIAEARYFPPSSLPPLDPLYRDILEQDSE